MALNPVGFHFLNCLMKAGSHTWSDFSLLTACFNFFHYFLRLLRNKTETERTNTATTQDNTELTRLSYMNRGALFTQIHKFNSKAPFLQFMTFQLKCEIAMWSFLQDIRCTALVCYRWNEYSRITVNSTSILKILCTVKSLIPTKNL